MTVDELIAELESLKAYTSGDSLVTFFKGARVVPVATAGTMRKALWDGYTSHDVVVLIEEVHFEDK
jgi:hypothetical protein